MIRSSLSTSAEFSRIYTDLLNNYDVIISNNTELIGQMPRGCGKVNHSTATKKWEALPPIGFRVIGLRVQPGLMDLTFNAFSHLPEHIHGAIGSPARVAGICCWRIGGRGSRSGGSGGSI